MFQSRREALAPARLDGPFRSSALSARLVLVVALEGRSI